MKAISTTVSTGDTVIQGDRTGIVGTYKRGEVSIKWKISDTACISDTYSTRKLNQLLNNRTIKRI